MTRVGRTVLASAAMLGLMFVPSPPSVYGGGTAAAIPSDFNGDGYADLAVGVPGEQREAGAVHVLFGSAVGLTASGDQQWTQDSPGVKGRSEGFDQASPGDEFGSALATGDFDHDGYADLAISVPGDRVGNDTFSGSVNVLYGSATGLTAVGDQWWSAANMPGDVGVVGLLAAADFDADGFVDLAFCAYHLQTPTQTTVVLRGSLVGLTTANATILAPTTCGNAATGDIDNDGIDDLAVGDGETLVGQASAGSVSVYYGGSDGLTTDGSERWTQESPGVEGEAESGDRFGSSLVMGDFDADGFSDLAIGVPGEDAVSHDGAVAILFGSSDGLSAEGSQLWHQDVAGVPDTSEPDDLFGWALAAGDFDGDGADDLAIGVPGEAPGTIIDDLAWGAVIALYGGSSGLSTARAQSWSQNSAGVPGTTERSDSFGACLASANYGRSGRDDLAIGVASEDVGRLQNAGVIDVLYGRLSGLSGTNAQGWSQNSVGVKGAAWFDEYLGSSLTP